MSEERTYFCIDMKCFFASVECAERGLNPFETNLVVADESRGTNALCLAISPKMKTLGCKNRCRMSEIPKNIRYIVAKPRMKKYIEYAADIYDIYLDYIDPNDIHVYSIDEAFIDATGYLEMYKKDAKEFAKFLINEIANRKHIPAAAGIGTNLYLAKVALDITAKKTKDHIGYLTEELYRETLWHHRPITDFWQIASGTARRLAKYYVYDMAGIASMSEQLLYKTFGINAELLIDHAYGRESCLISDIKAYQPKSKSISSSQILFEDYSYDKALI
jgi:DNA polymerase V